MMRIMKVVKKTRRKKSKGKGDAKGRPYNKGESNEKNSNFIKKN